MTDAESAMTDAQLARWEAGGDWDADHAAVVVTALIAEVRRLRTALAQERAGFRVWDAVYSEGATFRIDPEEQRP